jgi:hypothetical protein
MRAEFFDIIFPLRLLVGKLSAMKKSAGFGGTTVQPKALHGSPPSRTNATISQAFWNGRRPARLSQ